MLVALSSNAQFNFKTQRCRFDNRYRNDAPLSYLTITLRAWDLYEVIVDYGEFCRMIKHNQNIAQQNSKTQAKTRYLENIRFDSNQNVSIEELCFFSHDLTHIFHNLHNLNIFSTFAPGQNVDYFHRIPTTVCGYWNRISSGSRNGTGLSTFSIPT